MIVRCYYRIKEYYYKQKVWILNCFKYKRALTITDDFDYEGSLSYMRTHFSNILTAMQKGYYLQEADKTRKVKEKDIHRLIDLIDSRMGDDYASRCGYDDDFETIMNEDEEGEYLTFTSTLTDDQKENNSKALEDGIKLEEKEWKELIRLLGKMRGWWI